MKRFAVVVLVASLALAAGRALAQGDGRDYGDWGDYGDWQDYGWDEFDWGDWGIGDNWEDPSDFASDVDTDYEGDEILALNLSRAGIGKARALGFRVQERRPLRALELVLVRLRPPRGMNARVALARLRAADPASFYDHNTVYRLAGAGTCEGLRCYGHRMIGWEPGGCGARSRIGMIDSAVDLRSPALAGRAIEYRRLHRSRPSAAEADHGTAVAALLVGAPDSAFPGLLPQAALLAADVFSTGRNGEITTDAARLATALDWLAERKVGVINVSITGPEGGVLRVAIGRVLKSGIAVVAAAGNLGPEAPAQYPAAYAGVTAVTAVDRNLRVYGKANRGAYVALAAPGVGIWTVGPDGAGVFREGTSFAAPFATAAVALLRSREPRLVPATLMEHLKGQARDLGAAGNDPVFGWGLVQTRDCAVAAGTAAS